MFLIYLFGKSSLRCWCNGIMMLLVTLSPCWRKKEENQFRVMKTNPKICKKKWSLESYFFRILLNFKESLAWESYIVKHDLTTLPYFYSKIIKLAFCFPRSSEIWQHQRTRKGNYPALTATDKTELRILHNFSLIW